MEGIPSIKSSENKKKKRKISMATNPGFLTEWPWAHLGRFKVTHFIINFYFDF